MRVVYLAAPLSAPTREGIDENRHVASLWAAWALAQGVSPSCSWIALTSVLDETPENRTRGLAADFALVERADEVWLVGGRISAGMQLEADHGRARGLPVIDCTSHGRMPPGTPETGRDG